MLHPPPAPRRSPLALSFYVLAFQILSSAAFSWVLGAPPQQCSNLSIAITGSDGLPPYRILIVPVGPTPLPNNKEVRQIIDQSFNESSFSFAINYPANSEFVAVVSDARQFGTGGTSMATKVSSSGDSTCLNTTAYSPLFYYYIGEDDRLSQCQTTRIWWKTSVVQGTPSFVGIIPGGQSFPLQESAITKSSKEGTGFSWTPSIRGGTTIIVVASDDRGTGTGGSAPFTVQLQTDTSCLNSQSPSSTPGSPAGAYSTSTSSSSSTSATSSSSSSGGHNGTKTATLIGSVVGGVVGGFLLLIALILLFYCFRRSHQTGRKLTKQPMSAVLEVEPTVTTGLMGQTFNETRDSGLSQYNPEPFIAGPSSWNTEPGSTRSTNPRLASMPSGGLTDVSSASSALAGGPHLVPREPGNHSLSMASSASDQGRGIDFIQHQDAGLMLLPPVEQRIVELPPQYSDNIRPPRFSYANNNSKRPR